jgi:cardiolipin synthase
MVRVLVDDVGSSAMKRSMIDAMRAAGIKFARFNPVMLHRIRSRVDFRNHRKIVVCDGTVGFTGGINICDDYVPDTAATDVKTRRAHALRGHPAPWRDTHVRLEGDAVRWLQLTFFDDWQYATGYVARQAEYFPPAKGTGSHCVQIVASGPDRDFEPIHRLYFAAIGLATSRVLVTTPYFVPDDAILSALATAALRGVDVRILVPRRSDSLVVTAAARSYYDDVIAAGARVYEYQPTMVHAKTLVVDDIFSSVGTVNMDNRSFRLNFEVTAILYGSAHADELAKQFDKDLENAKEIKRHSRERIPLRWRFAEAGARLLSPLL